jgi:hypothetical protein
LTEPNLVEPGVKSLGDIDHSLLDPKSLLVTGVFKGLVAALMNPGILPTHAGLLGKRFKMNFGHVPTVNKTH